jgi:hypothetical protein
MYYEVGPVRCAFIILVVLAVFDNSAFAGSLSDVQLDNVCSGSGGCCPAGLCNGNPSANLGHVDLLKRADNNRNAVTGGANPASAHYTVLSGQAAVAEVRALLGSK